MLRDLGAEVREVRLAADLHHLDGLAIPGGESTTMSNLMKVFSLTDALRDFATRRPVLATCAGAILLAESIEDGPVARGPLRLLDICVRRNAWGRQVHSFESSVTLLPPVPSAGRSFPGVFIRAPRIVSVGPRARPIAVLEQEVVGVLQGGIMALTFHPELTSDTRIHRMFLDIIKKRGSAGALEPSVIYAEV